MVVLDQQRTLPTDTLFGRSLRESGFATPLVVLGFCATWAFPFLTAVVAGDVFSAEDQHGTWKTALTRSVRRGDLFVGKVLVAVGFALAVLVVLAVSSLGAGVLLVGAQPLVGLSGTALSPPTSALVVLASWATAALPLLGFTALAVVLSVASRSSWVGVVGPVLIGLVMQLLALLPGAGGLRRLLLTTSFESWRGFVRTAPSYDDLVSGSLVALAYLAACLGVAWWLLARREFA